MNLLDMQKVLVADDDIVARQVLAELLKPEHLVHLAKNGAQTLELAARHLPDLMLLDVVMPDMDGYEVLRRLRAAPETAHIAVIFISALVRPEDEAAGLKMGAADYITKPFNPTVVMARVAMHLQMVRQRRMLEHMAHVDGLTELANRRRFDEVYYAEWQRSRRDGRPLSLALLDLDAFKQYNDRYGHPAGDRALRAVARAASAGLRRPGDLAARYGGEELVLVMPDTDAVQAQQVVGGICRAVAALQIPHDASSAAPMLTVSAGGATLVSGATENSSDLFAAADALMYEAKKAGRNRVAWRVMAPDQAPDHATV